VRTQLPGLVLVVFFFFVSFMLTFLIVICNASPLRFLQLLSPSLPSFFHIRRDP
jgi:hypothetical protein